MVLAPIHSLIPDPCGVTPIRVTPSTQRLTRSSMIIALIACVSGIVSVPGTLSATPVSSTAAPGDVLPEDNAENYFLPTLSNTEESDRTMLREISDRHIFEPDSASAKTAQPVEQITSGKSQGSVVDSTYADNDPNNLWSVLRSSQPMRLRVTRAVNEQRQQYIKDALWVNRLLMRATPFLPSIIARLTERSLPLDLALLPAIESGFKPFATSSGSAAGLWQIVPETAQDIGLKLTDWVDQRTDLVHSTRAALDYLSYLNAEFHGDWELTLAAYNAGPGRVKAALRQARKQNTSVDFWSLNLPPETRRYVPKVTALISLVRERPASPLALPAISVDETFKVVDAGVRISLSKVAELAGVPEIDIRQLNGGLVHGVTPPEGPHRLLLPIDAVDQFQANLAKANTAKTNIAAGSELPLTHKAGVHIVAEGDSISSIAYRYKLSQQQLRALNGITGDKILLGQKLSVLDIRQQNTVKKVTVANDANLVNYTIKTGDTLTAIAQSFNISVADIAFPDGSVDPNRVLIPGRKLKIQIPATDSNS